MYKKFKILALRDPEFIERVSETTAKVSRLSNNEKPSNPSKNNTETANPQ